jgi:acetamidase/formamidase
MPMTLNNNDIDIFKSIPPVISIQSGETVTFDCLDASNGQIRVDSTVGALSSLVFSQLDQVNGPIYVEGAVPGDTLQVEVISVDTADWGWTGLIPGFGLLSDEFPEPALKIWKLDKAGGFAYFDEGRRIKIPLRPFAGEMGVAPGKSGAFSTIPPYNTGGNIDTKHVSAGATLFLPIEVEGALFSIGVRDRPRMAIFFVDSQHVSSRTVMLHKETVVSGLCRLMGYSPLPRTTDMLCRSLR